MREIVITQGDQGRTFEVHQGDLVLIRLEENPTTGYEWKVGSCDDQVIACQDSEYSSAAGTGIGGGGIRTFTFKARSRGTSKIQLKLSREWELEDADIRPFEVGIRVR